MFSFMSYLGSRLTLTSEMVNHRTVLSTCLQKENHFVTLCVLHLGHSKLTRLVLELFGDSPLRSQVPLSLVCMPGAVIILTLL